MPSYVFLIYYWLVERNVINSKRNFMHVNNRLIYIKLFNSQDYVQNVKKILKNAWNHYKNVIVNIYIQEYNKIMEQLEIVYLSSQTRKVYIFMRLPLMLVTVIMHLKAHFQSTKKHEP